jgi:single-stranded-DNA-specific exonuclease
MPPVGSLEHGRNWLRAHGADAVVVPHHDADGLSAGALLAGATSGDALHVASPWDAPLAVDGPAVVADWGVRPVTGPSSVLYVDHHAAPERVEGVVVSPSNGGSTSTSLLAWKLLGRPAGGAWLAALGAVGDLGAGALKRRDVPAVGSHTSVAKLASLITAAGRIHDGPIATAFHVLADSADEAQALEHPGRAELDTAAATVGESRARALRTPPRVGSDAALLRFAEPACVHPIVATAWARRLAPRVVIAANDAWRDGRVSFAVRSADGRDLRAWLLTRWSPPAGTSDYARGHAQATGGVLDPDAFEEFARAVLA